MLRAASVVLCSSLTSGSLAGGPQRERLQNPQRGIRRGLANNVVPARKSFVGSTAGHRRASVQYLQALQLARDQQFDNAREAFAISTAAKPDEEIAWVSWAQMEKRTETLSSETSTHQRFRRSRAVLQQGLQLNPHSARICQAWGLLELQAGNTWAALALLERASRADPACAPVLRWRPVQAARLAVSLRRQHVTRNELNTIA